MEDMELLLQDIVVTKFDIATDHWVHVITITDPHNFYVRPTKCVPFIKKLEASKPKTKPDSLSEHQVVLYNMDQECTKARFGRGKICKIVDGEKYEIMAMDYGFYHKSVRKENIWECDEVYSKIPPLALYCQLGNCASLGGKPWTETSIEAFTFFVGDERARMFILDKSYDKLVVELLNSNPEDIATLMALTGYSSMGYDHNTTNALIDLNPQKMYLNYKKININDTLHVRVQSGKSLDAFYVAEVKDYLNYLKVYDDITYLANQEPNLTEERFKCHTPVCVKNKFDKYERAIITDITVPGGHAKVKLLDWGKVEEAHISNMKPIPGKYLEMPVVAIYCSGDEKQKWDNALHRTLRPGYEFLIQIKQLGNEFESPNIVTIIPLEGHSSKSSMSEN